MSDAYLIWSHEHRAWWGPGGGYTSIPGKAGRYSQAEALRICADAIVGTAMRLGALPELPVRETDLDAMRDAFLAAYPGQNPESHWLNPVESMMPCNDNPPDFACQDCGCNIYRFPRGQPAPKPPRCGTCAWLVEFVPDEAERTAMREWMAGKIAPANG